MLITAAAALLAVVAMTGVAVDMGRMYIAKNEAQAYVDSAALAAVLELDGTGNGLQRARNDVAANLNKWNLGNSSFSGTTTEFSLTSIGPWSVTPVTPVGVRFVRVTTGVNVPLNFVRVVTTHTKSFVRAEAVAGQELRFSLDEGLCPFSPYAHDPNSPPHFGLSPGEVYTLRWASNINSQGNVNHFLCPGDRTSAIRALVQSGNADDRGYIEDTSAFVIRQAIVYDLQTYNHSIGDSVVMTGGVKQTQQDALIERVLQDTDTNANNFTSYLGGNNGNGRRMIACPVNAGPPTYTIVSFALFFLQREQDYQNANSANKPFCAEYVGPYVKGSNHPGTGPPGYYVGRLYQ